MQVDNGAATASSAAPSAALAPAIPGEPISLLLKESVIVILQKDGGVDNMEVQGTIALQVTALLWCTLTAQVHQLAYCYPKLTAM